MDGPAGLPAIVLVRVLAYETVVLFETRSEVNGWDVAEELDFGDVRIEIRLDVC